MARRHNEVIQAMKLIGATSRERRASSAEIVAKIDGQVCGKSFCCIFADLKRRKVVRATIGRTGGYWLTGKGGT